MWDTYHLSGDATVARPCVFVRAESMPKAAKAGLGRSHGDELVQRTLDGSVQRPSPEADRARPAATVPAQANRRKKRKATGSAGEPPAAAARSPTAASQGHSDWQPAATAAQDGSQYLGDETSGWAAIRARRARALTRLLGC